MRVSERIQMFTMISMLLISAFTEAYDGRPWYDEKGNETGLINYNPDPNDEPWLAGGLTPLTREERSKIDAMPELKLTAKTRGRELPSELILMENSEFIPVFNQVGGSCAQASGVAYTYSYQYNVLYGLEGTDANARAYGFTHNYLNDGNNGKGSWYWDGWEILSNHGAPSVETFHGEANGGLSGTRWMNGGERWHAANDNKALKYEKITINSLADIEKVKSWMYDLNGTDPYKKGGCVVFAANASSATGNSTVSSGKHAGDKLCTGLTGANMNHAMTFAGYSDEVEGGSFLLLNSWGSKWGTNGCVWVPYTKVVNGGLHKNEVWCVTVGKNTPLYEMRATVSHGARSNLVIKTGYATEQGDTAEIVKGYGAAFNKRGGSLSIEGLGGATSIEISLDISEAFDAMKESGGTFFMIVDNGSGPCTVSDLRLMDFTGVEADSILAEESSYTISGSTSLKIPYALSGKRYSITSRAIGNGSLSTEGEKLIDSAADYTYTFTPDEYHLIDSVLVDGENIGTDKQYTFTNVTGNHTIDVYFGWDEATPTLYTIECKKDEGGSISPAGEMKVAEGSNKKIELTPNEWHYVDSLIVDGVNRGPVVSLDFTYLTGSHTVVPHFSEEKYPGKYEFWKAGKTYGNGVKDTVSYKGHLWESNYWTKGNEPGPSPHWRDLGEEIIEQTDTLKIALMEYRSNEAKRDTIIITNLAIFKGDTATTVDTITDAVAVFDKEVMVQGEKVSLFKGGKLFFAPLKGSYTVTLFDLRGRVLVSQKLEIQKAGLHALPIDHSSLSMGMYLLQINSNKQNLLEKVVY